MDKLESKPNKIFKELFEDDEENLPIRIESLCMNCENNGITQIFCIKIPFYKQVILLSFKCEHCGLANNELQSGEPCQEHGTEIVLNVNDEVDLSRQVVRSEYAEVKIPELDLVIPAKSQTGEVTTVEGVLSRVQKALEQDQTRRWNEEAELASQLEVFISRIQQLMNLEKKFTLVIKDASGNSFIQNPNPFHVDKHCIISHYSRSLEERKMLGLADDYDIENEPADEWKSYEEAKAEVLRFPTECSNCGSDVETCMKPTDIPYFSTVIIMCTVCDHCGHRTTEVKSGSGVKDLGCKLSLCIEKEADFERDVLKSDTCYLLIPELDFEAGPNTLSGKFTTVEGLLKDARDQIANNNLFVLGDSAVLTEKWKMENFLSHFDSAITLNERITLTLDDPAGNSYIQSLVAPLNDDRLKKEFYVRTMEQNDELGLNDMKTENYGELETVVEEEL